MLSNPTLAAGHWRLEIMRLNCGKKPSSHVEHPCCQNQN